MIALCRDGVRLSHRHLIALVIHRLSLARRTPENPDPVPDHLLTGEDTIRAFKDRRMGTGGRPPYHGLIRLDNEATLDQVLRLGVRGSHAGDTRPEPLQRGYNWRTLAIAVAGNSDERPITPAQYARLVQVVTELLPLGRELVGHTDLPFASKDPDKRCPGRYLDLHPVLTAATFRLPMGWKDWELDQRRAHAAAAGWEL